MVRLLLISIVALLGFAAYQESEISSLRAQLSALEATRRASASPQTPSPQTPSPQSHDFNPDSASFPAQFPSSAEGLPAPGVARNARSDASIPRTAQPRDPRLPALADAGKPAPENASTADSPEEPSPFVSSILTLAQRAAQLDKSLRGSPEKEIPEMELLSEADWLKVAKEFPALDSERDTDAALKKLRKVARDRFSSEIVGTVQGMTPEVRQQFSGISSAAELNRFLSAPMNEGILNRYEVVHASALGPEWRTTDPSGESMLPQLVIRERAPGGGALPESKLQMGFYLKNGMVQKIITSDVTAN